MHASREGQDPEWFASEGLKRADNPDFENWRVRTYSVEVPTPERPTGRVVCEYRGMSAVRIVISLAAATGELVGLEVADASLFGVPGDPKPISARMLRDIPFGEIETSARESLRWELATRHHSVDDDIQRSMSDGGHILRDSVAAYGRPGRRGRNDVVYADLASEYVRIGGKRPVADLAGAQNLSESRVRNMLSEARRRGLLTRPAKGKSGGQLTKKALDLLSQQKENG